MSNFVVEKEQLEHMPYMTETDLMAGLRSAIQYNQMVLAMQYVEMILGQIDKKLSETSEQADETKAKTASRATKAKPETATASADAD